MVNGKDVSRHEVHMADRLLDTHREANQSDSLSAGQSSFWGNKSVRESARETVKPAGFSVCAAG